MTFVFLEIPSRQSMTHTCCKAFCRGNEDNQEFCCLKNRRREEMDSCIFCVCISSKTSVQRQNCPLGSSTLRRIWLGLLEK